MKKIPSLFKRDHGGTEKFINEVTPGCEWVLNGEGWATQKWDGTACMIRDRKLYKRYDAKNEIKRLRSIPEADLDPLYLDSIKVPDGFIAAQNPDLITGHYPGWVPVDLDRLADQWHIEAWMDFIRSRSYAEDGLLRKAPLLEDDGTYELIGPKINGNRHGFDRHVLIRHGQMNVPELKFSEDGPRTFESVKEFIFSRPGSEGIVFYHEDGRMAKAKYRDFF